MFHVEEMRAADFPFAVQLANTMDWNMAEEDFEFMLKLEPHGCFVLFSESERVGIATSVSYGRVGWFGNLIVKEAFRQKGAGPLLVKHAADFLRKQGVQTVGLYAYQNLIGFYQKLGFKLDADFSVLHAKAVDCQAGGTLEEADERLFPSLIEFDRECFSGNRKKLLESILLSQGNLCYVSMDGDKVFGFVAAKVYGEMAEVGPLVCHRNRADIAVSLLKAILSKLRNIEVHICLPSDETALLETLNQAGFTEDFRVTRMFLGPATAKPCIYVAESLERG